MLDEPRAGEGADRTTDKVRNDRAATPGTLAPPMPDTREDSANLPWDERDERFVTGTEAERMSDGKMKPSAISKLCKPDGPVRYMRKKGVGLRLHVADFRQFLKNRHSGDRFDALDDYVDDIEQRKAEASAAKGVQR